MNVIRWMLAGTGALLIVWAGMAAAIVLGDRRDRRAYEAADARREWREFVDAMRRLEQYDRDAEGSA